MTHEYRVKAQGRLLALVDWYIEGFSLPLEIAVRPPGIRVVARVEGGSKIWMTREFRRETESNDLRLPGGRVFDDIRTYLPAFLDGSEIDSELIVNSAVREFREEVGLELESPWEFVRSVAGATVKWDLHYVVGNARRNELARELESGEPIEPVLVRCSDIHRLIETGKIGEERSAVALLRLIGAGTLLG